MSRSQATQGGLRDGSDRAPEEGLVLDVPPSNVAVIEGNIQLGKQLSSFSQTGVGWQHQRCDVVPVAGDGCCVCNTQSHPHSRFHTLDYESIFGLRVIFIHDLCSVETRIVVVLDYDMMKRRGDYAVRDDSRAACHPDPLWFEPMNVSTSCLS